MSSTFDEQKEKRVTKKKGQRSRRKKKGHIPAKLHCAKRQKETLRWKRAGYRYSCFTMDRYMSSVCASPQRKKAQGSTSLLPPSPPLSDGLCTPLQPLNRAPVALLSGSLALLGGGAAANPCAGSLNCHRSQFHPRPVWATVHLNNKGLAPGRRSIAASSGYKGGYLSCCLLADSICCLYRTCLLWTDYQ